MRLPWSWKVMEATSSVRRSTDALSTSVEATHVGNDLDTVVLPDTNARVRGSEIDTVCARVSIEQLGGDLTTTYPTALVVIVRGVAFEGVGGEAGVRLRGT